MKSSFAILRNGRGSDGSDRRLKSCKEEVSCSNIQSLKVLSTKISGLLMCSEIGPLHDPVTWYGINYTGTQVTQWDFQNKGTRTSPARLSFVLKVPLRNLRPSVIYSVPCDRIVQRAYW